MWTKRTPNNMAGLAGSQPHQSDTQSIKQKGRGAGQAPALHSEATCDSGTSCTLSNALRAVSWGSTGPHPHWELQLQTHTRYLDSQLPMTRPVSRGAEEPGNATESFVHNIPGELKGHSLLLKSCPSQSMDVAESHTEPHTIIFSNKWGHWGISPQRIS